MEKMKELYDWQTTWDRYVKRTATEEPKQETSDNVERRKVKVPRKKR